MPKTIVMGPTENVIEAVALAVESFLGEVKRIDSPPCTVYYE